MKKSAKPLIVALLLMLLIVTTLILFVIGTRFKYEELIRERISIESELKAEQTRRTNLFAEYQMVSAENIIVQSAKQDLGMIQDYETINKISVEKSEIDQINQKLSEKYD